MGIEGLVMTRKIALVLLLCLTVFGCEGDYTIYDAHPPEVVYVDVPVEVLNTASQGFKVRFSLRSIERTAEVRWQPANPAVLNEGRRGARVLGINLQSLVAEVQQTVHQPLHVTGLDVEPIAPNRVRSSKHQNAL